MPTNTPYDPGHPFTITSHFGKRPNRDGIEENHSGVDYGAPEGTPVPAASEGCVVFSGNNPTYGNTVIIEHTNPFGRKFYTLYAHMKDNANAHYGVTVKAGDKIGEVGKTGTSRGFHLHFEVLLTDGFDDQGPYFGKTRERLNISGNGSNIGVPPKVGRSNPEIYHNYGGEVFAKGATGYKSSYRDGYFSYADMAGKARRSSAAARSGNHGNHGSDNGTLVRHGNEVTRIEPDGSTRGSFHSE